jgi:hypothetical protein
MSENSLDLLGTKGVVDGTLRSWADVDSDEQEYLDRLATFGEGFQDLSARFPELVRKNGDIGNTAA